MIAALQASARLCFLHADALFNRALGERMNPLYHLGSIACVLFWIVAASGLYLYAFFDTGVADAYASVEALTRNQWFAGGVLRSLHRYASDALVVVMFIHMIRCFAFDRMRGFRWLAWSSGVALIWLVYASGVNGFMLPWDELAQFVVTASLEWLSWLPGFGAALIRNVVHSASLSDRFFSLLVFVHIGVPLMLLLVMWIHVQQVPKAKMLPPRGIGVSVLLALLALALLLPVASQGPADLGTAPATLALDWFYLAGFLLLYSGSAGALWALAAAITLLFASVPWLPPWHGRGRTRDFWIEVYPGPSVLMARAGETLLDAGLRAGVALPFECRNGGCGLCVCTVVRGRVDHGSFQSSVLTSRMRERGKTLLCCATALSDLEIEVDALTSIGRVAPRTHRARVVALDRLSEDIILIRLKPVGGERIRFEAGQYLNIVLEDGQRRAFSFANAPHDNQEIELHVRRIPGGRFTTRVFTDLRIGDTLRFECPFGRFSLRDGAKPLLLVAGATGFAPVKSIVEDAFHRGIQRSMRLYWGARRRKDLYMLELAQRWEREHSNFSLTAVLSESVPDGWQRRRGLVHEALLADAPDLSGFEVYVCGSVQMVETAVPAFLARGVGEEDCACDAFLPAARATAPVLRLLRPAGAPAADGD